MACADNVGGSVSIQFDCGRRKGRVRTPDGPTPQKHARRYIRANRMPSEES
jgi:hypothetical protein